VFGDETSSAEGPPDRGERVPRRRAWVALGAAVVIGFVVLVVTSTRQAAVPVGASGAMSGMSMPMGASGRLALTMRDVENRALRLPDGRPGIAVFVETGGCGTCVEAVRAAARAVRRSGETAALIVVSIDSGTSRGAVAAFARAAGQPAARYVLDDRNGSLASMFGASGLGAAVVYDARGGIVARPSATAAGLARALRRAGA